MLFVPSLQPRSKSLRRSGAAHRLGPSQERDADWVGCHLESVKLGSPADSAGVPFITVQLTDPASGATRVLIRGGVRATQAQLMAYFKQEVRRP